MLGGVVDDAHQPRAGGDRRIPVGVDDSGEFFGWWWIPAMYLLVIGEPRG